MKAIEHTENALSSFVPSFKLNPAILYKKCLCIGLNLFLIPHPFRRYIVEDGFIRKQNFTIFGYNDDMDGETQKNGRISKIVSEPVSSPVAMPDNKE